MKSSNDFGDYYTPRFHAINVQAVVDSELRYVVNKETLFI
jgi:hypothetical protein